MCVLGELRLMLYLARWLYKWVRNDRTKGTLSSPTMEVVPAQKSLIAFE